MCIRSIMVYYIVICCLSNQAQTSPTSFCADWSQHLYETNRITSCCIKSLRIFFGGHFKIVVALWRNLSCNTDFKMPYCRKLYFWQIQHSFVKRYLEMTQNTFFMYIDKEVMKPSTKKIFRVLYGLPSKNTTIFFFWLFVSTFMKNVFCIISRSF